jgi:hypothetical protein
MRDGLELRRNAYRNPAFLATAQWLRVRWKPRRSVIVPGELGSAVGRLLLKLAN